MVPPQAKVVALALLAVLASGCLERTVPGELKPLEFVHIWIYQGAPIPADAAAGYVAWITLCTAIRNVNPVDVMMRDGEAWYQVRTGASGEELVLVDQDQSPPVELQSNWTVGRTPTRFFAAEEIATGGSNRYAIRVWNEILDTEPLIHTEQWYNVTIVPYTSQNFEGSFSECNRA